MFMSEDKQLSKSEFIEKYGSNKEINIHKKSFYEKNPVIIWFCFSLLFVISVILFFDWLLN